MPTPLDELERIPPEIAALISAATARRLRAIPLGLTGETPPALRVAMRSPGDLAAIQQLRALTGLPIVPVELASMHLGPALDRIYAHATVAPAPPPAPTIKPSSDDWKRIPVTDGPDTVLHGWSMGKTVLSAIVVSALGIGIFYFRVWRWDRKHQPPETRYYGIVRAPDVGIDFEFSTSTPWAPAAHAPGFAQYGRGRDERLEFRRISGTTDLRAAAQAAIAASTIWDAPTAFTAAQCGDSDDRPPPSMVCHSPGFHQWAWPAGADTLVVTLECRPDFPVEAIGMTVQSVSRLRR